MRACGLVVVLVVASLVACGEPPAEPQSASASAYTVDRGDRFVASATPERIELWKEVAGAPFPFDDASLRGKAILIHPVAKKAEAGVYARAVDVEDGGDRWIVHGEALTLAEMESIAEDDIVRIYLDRGLRPGSIRPLAAGDESGPELDLTSVTGLSRSASPVPGVTVAHEVQSAKLTPTPLVRWTREDGLELGLRLDLSWRSTIAARGEKSGEIFRSQTIETRPYVVLVTIGAVPVPITFTASAFVACSAALSGVFDASVAFAADASISGSAFVRDGIARGSWPPSASGSASVTPSATFDRSASVTCTVPRLELRAAVAGVAGVYVAVVPVAQVNQDGVSLEAGLFAGADARFLGQTFAKETKLVSWKAL